MTSPSIPLEQFPSEGDLNLSPALTISPSEIDQALDILDASLAEVRKS